MRATGSFLLFALLLVAVDTRADDQFESLVKAGKYQDAIQYAEKNIPSDKRTVEVWLSLALSQKKSGASSEQQLASYLAAQKANPSDPRAISALGSHYYDMKNYAEAMRLFQTSFLLQRTAESAENISLCAANLGKWDKAKDAAETAVSIDSTVVECRSVLLRLFQNEKNWAGVAEQLRFILKSGNGTVDQWKLLAVAAEKAGLRDLLVRSDSVIVLLDKSNVASRKRFAEYSLARKDTAAAIRLFKDLAILTPTDPVPFRNLYQLSDSRGSIDDAALYLRNFLLLDSSRMELYWQLGDLLYEKKDRTGALDAYRIAFRRNPKGRGHFARFAELVLQNKLDKEATSVITAAIAAGEATPLLQIALGDIYRKSNQYPAAVKQYQEALKKEPSNLSVLASLAECQGKSGDFVGAVVSYEQLVLMNPKASAEHLALGDLNMKLGKKAAGIAAYKKYCETVTKECSAAKAIGMNAFEAGQWADAVRYLRLVQDSARKDVAVQSALGLSAYKLGDCKAAIDAFVKIMAGKPAPAVLSKILLPCADCLERSGNITKAAEAYGDYIALPGVKDPEAAFKAAFLIEKSGQPGPGVLYEANTVSYPKDYRNFLQLGLLYANDPALFAKARANLVAASLLVDTIPVLWRTLATIEGKLKNESAELAAWKKLLVLAPKDLTANRRAGTILAATKQYAAAVSPLEIAASSSDDYDLLRLLATCYIETKKVANALALLRKLKTLRPDDAALRVTIISLALSAGETAPPEKDELAGIDMKTAAKNPKDIESRRRLLQNDYAKKDPTGVINLLKELSILTPKDTAVFKKLYEISFKNGSKREAAEYLRKYLALNAQNAQGWRLLGDILYEIKDSDNALAAYRTAVKLDSKIKGFYRNYIDLVLQKNLTDEAITVIRSAIAFSEADAPAYLALADIYRKKNQCAEAIPVYAEALKLNPKDIETMVLLGECQTAVGDIKNAMITFEQVVMMKPEPSREYKLLGDLQMQAGKTDAAMANYRKYLADNSADQKLAKIVGMYDYEKNNHKAALSNLELVKDPALQSVDYLVALGESYYKTGQLKKAIESLSHARAAKPAPAMLVRIMKMLTDSYDKTGDQSKLLETCDAYTKLPGVRDPEASYRCGFLREKSDPKAAIREYTANTAAYPKDHRNFLRLGLLLSADSTALDKAAIALKSAAALTDTIPLLFETLATISRKLGRADEELASLQKFLVLQPQNLAASKRTGELLLKKKSFDQAITSLEMVLTVSPNDIGTMLLLVQGYMETKRQPQALELLKKAKTLDRNSVEVRSRLYDLFRQNGQASEAEAEIKDLIEKPGDNKYRLLYARDLIAAKRYDDAYGQVAEIKSRDPMNVEGLMLRGSILRAQKKYDQAIETYKEISFINEEYAPALCERGDTYRLMGQYDRALQYLTKAQKADPKNSMAELGLALLAKTQNKTAEYKEHLAKARALDPKNPAVIQETGK